MNSITRHVPSQGYNQGSALIQAFEKLVEFDQPKLLKSN